MVSVGTIRSYVVLRQWIRFAIYYYNIPYSYCTDNFMEYNDVKCDSITVLFSV